jgi:hypothetical protein
MKCKRCRTTKHLQHESYLCESCLQEDWIYSEGFFKGDKK